MLINKKEKKNQLEWEKVYSEKGDSHKNKYPSEDLVSFVLGKYKNVKKRNSIRVLDLGCGWGNNTRFFHEEGFDVYAIDFSKSAIANVKKIIGDKAICVDGLQLNDYENNFFDLIVDRSSLQHNESDVIQKIYERVKRKLKLGGIFFHMILKKGDNGFILTRYNDELDIKLNDLFDSVEINKIFREPAGTETYIIKVMKCYE
eukprot:COSAG01_NODE_755_length_13819_cov_130.671939_13_plen_202_part_00